MSVIDRLNAKLRDRYEVERELGEGGMARLYLGRDLKHRRPVAIKVLKPELAAEVDAERFFAEIQTTANLQHPHILPLFDSGEADGLLFYVMPYVDGASLRERLEASGALSVEEAVRYGAALGDALDHAHRQGVVHRDVKPANVMVADGEPLLADFGIALALESQASDRLTRTGSSIGTPGYMSPEQAAGEAEVDARSDVYALGALTYEMLTGQRPLADLSPRAALAKILTEGPPPPAAVDDRIPVPVSDVVAKALAREPGDRHQTAGAFADALRGAARDALGASSGARAKPRPAVMAVAVVALVATGLASLALLRDDEARWARVEALPEIERLLGLGETAEAFRLASRALDAMPDDPVLADLYDAAAVSAALTSEPPGATVEYRPYDPEDSVWTTIGTTPTASVDLPEEELLLRFTLAGHHTRVLSFAPVWGQGDVELVPGDVRRVVPIASTSYVLGTTEIPLEGFRIDEHEVTNQEYREFLSEVTDWNPDTWVEPFEARGVEVDLERFRREFVDATGRPGPSEWELSRPPEGRDEFPVQGVSWYEAVAYCSWRGLELPTYYHWKVADAGGVSAFDGILSHANLVDGEGPVAVGTADAVSVLGVADLAGNVREWVWNAAGSDRYILGGSWLSPAHLYTDHDATDPWSRSPENGFRCASWEAELSPALYEPIDLPIFDFNGFEPVDDATYRVYASFFDYDPRPLEAEWALRGETDAWTRYLVEIDAAYLGERLSVHVFLPTDVPTPYQSVVYFPGAAARAQSSSTNVSEMSELMFIPRSGRALLYPVLKGTYERRFEEPALGMAEQRQRLIWMTQDIMRTLDLLEEDDRFDNGANGYLGLSFGAELAVPVALEKRFETSVLIGAALDPAWRGTVPDEVAPWNHVSRITTPTMVINGLYDFMHPYRESQVPFFQMIDVPDADKEFVVLDAGHLPPNNEVIAHTLRWLDARLGPVGQAGRR